MLSTIKLCNPGVLKEHDTCLRSMAINSDVVEEFVGNMNLTCTLRVLLKSPSVKRDDTGCLARALLLERKYEHIGGMLCKCRGVENEKRLQFPIQAIYD